MNKGFTIGPGSSAGSPMPRETQEQRLARPCQAQAKQHQRDQAAWLSRPLQCQIVNSDDFGHHNTVPLSRSAVRYQKYDDF